MHTSTYYVKKYLNSKSKGADAQVRAWPASNSTYVQIWKLEDDSILMISWNNLKMFMHMIQTFFENNINCLLNFCFSNLRIAFDDYFPEIRSFWQSVCPYITLSVNLYPYLFISFCFFMFVITDKTNFVLLLSKYHL